MRTSVQATTRVTKGRIKGPDTKLPTWQRGLRLGGSRGVGGALDPKKARLLVCCGFASVFLRGEGDGFYVFGSGVSRARLCGKGR